MNKKKVSAVEMLNRAHRFWIYWLALLLSGGFLVMIGGAITIESTGVVIPLLLKAALALGAISVILSFVCAAMSLKWEKRAGGH